MAEQTDTRENILMRESLSLKQVLNLARGEDPRAAIPRDGVWRNQYDDLVSAVLASRLNAIRIGDRPRHWRVYLDDLWRFASTADARWEWLREFCVRWAGAQGMVLESPERAAPQTRLSMAAARAWYEKRVNDWPKGQMPPSREDDEAAGRVEGISRDRLRKLRKDLAPPKWQRRGRRKTADYN